MGQSAVRMFVTCKSMEPLPSTSYMRNAHWSFSLGVPADVTSIAHKNSCLKKKKYKKKENVVFNLKGCGNKESKGVEKKKKRGENYTAANSLARWLITVIKNKLLLLLLLLLLGKGIINVVRATAQLVPGTTTRKRKGGWKTTVVWTRLIGNR